MFPHPFVVYTSTHYSENFPNFFTRRFQGLVEWYSWSVFAQLKTRLNFECFHWSWSFQILPCLGIYLNSILKSSRWDGDKCPYSAQSTGKQRVRVSCRSRVYIKNLTEIIWVREARRGDFSSKAVLINLIHHDKFTIQYERWGCLKMPFSVIQGWKKVCLKQRWKHHKPKSVIRIWTVAGWDNAQDRPRRRRHLAPPHRVHTDGNWLSTLARVLPERASKEAEVLPAHTIWQNSICGSWFVKENLWLFFNNSALAC